MKIYPIALALILVSPGAVAGTLGSDWITAEQVRNKLSAAGYTQVSELEADDGVWEGEGIKNGIRTEFRIDPKTGAFIVERKDDDDDD